MKIRNWGASFLAAVMMTMLSGFGMLMPTAAEAQYTLPPRIIEMNRNRFDLDLQMQMDDIMAAYAIVVQNYDATLAVTNDPTVPTRDNDARCNQKAKEKLGGMTMSNSTPQQKIDKTNELINMWKGASTADGGLGAAGGGYPNGWSSMWQGLPRESGQAFKELQIIAQDGSSWTARLYLAGGTGASPNNAIATAILDNKTPAATTGGSATPAACPRAG